MTRLFIPVPEDALETTEPEEWAAVTDLYRRAWKLQWRPFRVTIRSCAKRWNMTGHTTKRIIDDLADAGLLSCVVKKIGKRTDGLILTVHCPTKDVKHHAGHRAEHDADHHDADADGTNDDSANIEPGIDPGMPPITLVKTEITETLDPEENKAPLAQGLLVPAADPSLAVVFLAAVDSWKDHHGRPRLANSARMKLATKWLALVEEFPRIDHNGEVRSAEAWAVDNPKKTPKNALSFMRNWLGRARPPATAAAHRNDFVPLDQQYAAEDAAIRAQIALENQ